jgi:hypothetical protein
MRPDTIKRSFQATGVWPMDAEVVLKRFNNSTMGQDEASALGHYGDGNSWRELRKIFDAVVADKAKIEAQQLEASLHSLQTHNELLHHKYEGFMRALEARKKHKKKSKTMDLQQRKDYHGDTVFWSPRKLRKACAREATKQDEDEHARLQKTHNRELKAAATLYKKKQAEAAKVAQQQAAEERVKLKKAKAEKLAAARALKKQQRNAATAEKSHDTPNRPKRKASHSSAKSPTKRRRVVAAASCVEAGPLPVSPAQNQRVRTPNQDTSKIQIDRKFCIHL